MADIQKHLNKQFGDGTIFTFHDTNRVKVIPIASGIPSFDYASGIGGIPGGRIIEMYGPESSGKTTIALQIIANYQRLHQNNPESPYYKKRALYIDAEHALDPIHVEKIGVDCSKDTGMMINQPDYGEQAFDIIESACHSGEVGIIVGDSIAAFVPKAEIEGTNEDNQVGLQARMISKGLRKINGVAKKTLTSIIFINQLREKVGVMYGNPEVTPGGRSLKFYASMRIEVKRKPIQKKDVHYGQTISVTFKKNKVARPFVKAEFDYYWDTLFDTTKDTMNVACEMDIIHRKGAYYFLGPDPNDSKNVFKDGAGNELKWQGKPALEQTLKASPALFNYINDMVQGRIPKDEQFIEEEYEEEYQESSQEEDK